MTNTTKYQRCSRNDELPKLALWNSEFESSKSEYGHGHRTTKAPFICQSFYCRILLLQLELARRPETGRHSKTFEEIVRATGLEKRGDSNELAMSRRVSNDPAMIQQRTTPTLKRFCLLLLFGHLFRTIPKCLFIKWGRLIWRVLQMVLAEAILIYAYLASQIAGNCKD